MKHFKFIAALTVCAASIGLSISASALEKNDPGSCGGGNGGDLCPQKSGGGWGGVPGPGPGDGGSTMPPGGDAWNQKMSDIRDKQAENKKKGAEKTPPPAGVKTFGRVSTSSAPGPQRSMCDMARDARARNSPAAPSLEAQCRAGKP